jgi:hypothetical protein
MLIVTRIGGVMVSVLTSSAVYRGFEPWLGETKDYKIVVCCISAKHAALRNKDNVSEWVYPGLLFQWASTMKIQLSMLV